MPDLEVLCLCALTIWATALSVSWAAFEQDRLVDEGYNPSYGARPLRRAIMRLLEDSMAERMLSGEIKEGDSVIIDVDADGQVRLHKPFSRLPPLPSEPTFWLGFGNLGQRLYANSVPASGATC